MRKFFAIAALAFLASASVSAADNTIGGKVTCRDKVTNQIVFDDLVRQASQSNTVHKVTTVKGENLTFSAKSTDCIGVTGF